MQNNNIEFISYDGENPIFCFGILTVKILGKTEKFQNCLKSREEIETYGSEVLEEYPFSGYWIFNPQFNTLGQDYEQSDFEFAYFKKQSKKKMNEAIRLETERLVNKNIQQHCCDGCD